MKNRIIKTLMKKKKQITEKQFKKGLFILVIVIIFIFYMANIEERYMVSKDLPSKNHKDHLKYKTEFCANKLTELAHEIEFLKGETAQNLDEEFQQKMTIQIKNIENEFTSYSMLCNQLDANPDSKICDAFIKEAELDLEVAQAHANQTKGLEHFEIVIKQLGKSSRIYKGLKNYCDLK